MKMMKRIRTITLVALAAFLGSTLDLAAQARRVVRKAPGSGPETRPVTAEEKEGIAQALKEAIDQNYLFPGKVDEISARIDEFIGSGRYAEIDDARRLARTLTDDLRSFTGDLHFAVKYDPETFSRLETAAGEGAVRAGFGAGIPSPDPDSPFYRMMLDRFRPTNFEMRKLEILAGNVGYMRLDMMPPLEPARRTLDAAMTFIENTEALILDLRGTPGGVGGFIPYLMSYFFAEEDKLLYTREFGAEGRVEEYRTHEEIGGPRRPEVPIYILTDALTGSAAENLAYTLKHHGRATVVGETTAGGGHSARGAALVAGFTASIPMARVVHPVTGAGFDSVGVEPDVEVTGSEALETAHEMALEELLASAPAGSREETRLRAALDSLRSAARAARAAREMAGIDLSAYPGTYGERTVSLENGRLSYQRTGGPKVPLAPIGVDLFRLDLPARVRSMRPVPDIRFERNEKGRVTGLSLVGPDGTVEETASREG